MTQAVQEMSLTDAVEAAKKAGLEPRQWWMSVVALIDLQAEHPNLLQHKPRVYAPFWRWVAKEAHREFASSVEVFQLSRAAMSISAHPAIAKKSPEAPVPQMRRTNIGPHMDVFIPQKASRTVKLFIEKTEIRYD